MGTTYGITSEHHQGAGVPVSQLQSGAGDGQPWWNIAGEGWKATEKWGKSGGKMQEILSFTWL